MLQQRGVERAFCEAGGLALAAAGLCVPPGRGG